MKRERTLEAKIVKTRNELVDCLEREDIVIFVEGDLYEKMKDELSEPKTSKSVGKAGIGLGVLATVASPVVGIANIGLGLYNLLSGTAKDQIKNYNLKNNKELERVELYLAKGEGRYNKEFDTISNYDKERYEYEDWWKSGEEEKVHNREEIKSASDRLKKAEEQPIVPTIPSFSEVAKKSGLNRALELLDKK